MAFPKQVAIFTGLFGDIGEPTEFLQIRWNYGGYPGVKTLTVGTDIFLENPVNVSDVPDDQLLMSLSMSAILTAALPGTQEFMDAVSAQGTRYFQTIVGDVKLKQNPIPVDDSQIGPPGTVYDLIFQKVGQASNLKTIRADAWAISQYDNRVDSGAHAVNVVPGSIHKAFGFKKSQLGAAGSPNRQAVLDYIAATRFWV